MGFTGNTCQKEINECHSNSCIHGNCTALFNEYNCSCLEGFTGQNCETDIDECESDPCIHGNCTDLFNEYNCSCLEGFTGQNCETDIDECESDPCVHGNCTDLVNNFTCSCFKGYGGKLCGKNFFSKIDQTVCDNVRLCPVQDRRRAHATHILSIGDKGKPSRMI